MIDDRKEIYRWGPIPGYLINISIWRAIYRLCPGRLHQYCWPDGYVLFYKGNVLFINNQEPLDKVGTAVFKDIIITSKIKKYITAWQSAVKQLFVFTRQLSPAYLRSLETKELLGVWYKFNNLLYSFWEAGIVPELGAYGGEAVLKGELQTTRLSERQQQKALAAMSAASGISFFQEEEMDLLRLVKLYGRKSFPQQLRSHQQKYHWLENSYGGTKILAQPYFLRRIKEIRANKVNPDKKIAEIIRQQKKIQQKKQGLLRQLPQRFNAVSKGLGYCIWWQDQRKKYIFQYLPYLELLGREFARRLRLPYTVVRHAYEKEITLPASKENISRWKKRKAGSHYVFFQKNKVRIFEGAKARSIHKAYWKSRSSITDNTLHGLVVQPSDGLIRAPAYRIQSPKDLKKFPKGHVLVTAMTAPDYISAIRKAAAIVTDTGGVTCHAAIVARELGVPCIVGVRSATSMLRNGDRVEINTDQGTIKKL